MVLSNAERQAKYRKTRDFANKGEGEHRLNTWISTSSNFALERLAHRYGVTKRDMLERLLKDADDALLKSLDFEKPEWDEYFNVTA